MGYEITLQDSNAMIAWENAEAAFRRACELNRLNSLKTGGNGSRTAREDGEPNENIWFAWLPWNYDTTLSNLNELLEALGFNVWASKDGLVFMGYDTKTGAEQLFLACMAPFIESYNSADPFFEWLGEDGERWRLIVEDGVMYEQAGSTIWAEPVAVLDPLNES